MDMVWSGLDPRLSTRSRVQSRQSILTHQKTPLQINQVTPSTH